MDQMRYTKTFVEVSYYQRSPGDPPGKWAKVPTEEIPLDEQIREWVDRTKAVIVHPGQLGVHMEWHDQERTLRSVTLGQTVLYVEGAPHATGDRPGPQTAASPEGGGGRTRQPTPGTARVQAPVRAVIPVPADAGAIQPDAATIYPAIVDQRGAGPGDSDGGGASGAGGRGGSGERLAYLDL